MKACARWCGVEDFDQYRDAELLFYDTHVRWCWNLSLSINAREQRCCYVAGLSSQEQSSRLIGLLHDSESSRTLCH